MYQLSENCPKHIVFQTLESGYYDYSNCVTLEGAWHCEQGEAWVADARAEGRSLDSIKEEFLETLTEATPEEALKEAEDNFWPVALGYVEEVLALVGIDKAKADHSKADLHLLGDFWAMSGLTIELTATVEPEIGDLGCFTIAFQSVDLHEADHSTLCGWDMVAVTDTADFERLAEFLDDTDTMECVMYRLQRHAEKLAHAELSKLLAKP